MSAASGLQRRRAPGGEARTGTPYASDDEDDVVRGRSAQRVKDGIVERSAGSGSIAAIDTRSGQRYAYDPRDVGDEREMLSHPRLTLMEEVLLLGLKDRQGYLSFWNDNISYTLRGAILMELALRGRIAVARNGEQKRFEVADRLVEVRDAKNTGEPLLDETLRMIKSSPPAGIAEWMDLLSGETWNVMKLNLQLKQVRERLAKGLVDKGVLRTEKRNFLLFDMPTHPVADPSLKDAVLRRLYAMITSKSQSVHPDEYYKEEKGQIALRITRTLCMVCCAYCGNVLDNTLAHLPSETHEEAFQRVVSLLVSFGQWPMAPDTPGGGLPGRGTATSFSSASAPKKKTKHKIGAGDADLVLAMRRELEQSSSESAFEVIAGVLNVFVRMDALV